MRKTSLVAVAATLLVCGLGAHTSLASSDFSPSKVFSLIQADTANTVPFLTPTNDSRVNLLLLLADADLAHPHVPAGTDPAAKRNPYAAQAPLDLDSFVSVFDDRPASSDTASDFVEGQGDRCRSNAAGGGGYLAALGSSAVPQAEQALLMKARKALATACNSEAKNAVALPGGAIRSAQGKDFATYLTAAAAFYAGDFAVARQGFGGVMNSSQAWLKEAARYMIARADLNAAQAAAFGDYGELVPKGVGALALAGAQTAFRNYLHDYPHGHYVASALGLQRRLAWLGGDHAKLADAFGDAFENADPGLRNVSAVDLVYEADNKLLTQAQPTEIHEPRLLAALDLMKMRREDKKPAPLSRADLEAQRPLFARQKELFAYLLAAYAFYDEDNPAAALKSLDHTTAGPHMSYLQFSAQVLKGLALEATHNPAAARTQWLALIPLAEPVLQRSAVELALAQNYEQGGKMATVFAPDSPIRTPTYRERLLAYAAGPDLLRQRATAIDAIAHERQLSLYTLLFKELTRGGYRAFVDDLRLMPGALPETNAYDKLAIGLEDAPALTDFNWAGEAESEGFKCPSIRVIAAALADNAHAERSLICLGEFLRINNYDGFLRGDDPAAKPDATRPPAELSAFASQFPGVGMSRLDVYKTIIATPKAAPDVRAYALYRAVNCWAPSGNNSCDSTDAPKSQRKQWFEQLKSQYRDTVWAGKLQYYW